MHHPRTQVFALAAGFGVAGSVCGQEQPSPPDLSKQPTLAYFSSPLLCAPGRQSTHGYRGKPT